MAKKTERHKHEAAEKRKARRSDRRMRQDRRDNRSLTHAKARNLRAGARRNIEVFPNLRRSLAFGNPVTLAFVATVLLFLFGGVNLFLQWATLAPILVFAALIWMFRAARSSS